MCVCAVRGRWHGHADASALPMRAESAGGGVSAGARLPIGRWLLAGRPGNQGPGRMGRSTTHTRVPTNELTN